ncbi:MAG: helix-turn-helix domain-containing protein [Pseudonocardia sp.]
MTKTSTSTLTKRLYELRRRRGLTQRELADAAGISVDVIRKLEQGQRSSALLTTLVVIAQALDTDLGELIGTPRGLVVGAEDSEVLRLRQAVLGITPTSVEAVSQDDLQSSIEALWQCYWHAHYGDLARRLPAALATARATAHVATGADVRSAQASVAILLQLTASLLTQLAHEDLAHVALHSALAAAGQSGDELLHAAGQATRSWILSRQGLWSEAEHLALTTAAGIEPTLSTASVDHVAVWGDLLRYGAVALARSGRHSETSDVLGLMRAAAARMNGDEPTRYASRAFGPTIVAMRGVDNAILAGKTRHALNLAQQITHPENTPPGMHARYLLNVAGHR